VLLCPGASLAEARVVVDAPDLSHAVEVDVLRKRELGAHPRNASARVSAALDRGVSACRVDV